jgi:SAM-dependent methyltransferase
VREDRDDRDRDARRLAAESLDRDDPTGWFERLYAAAESGAAVVPWDSASPQRLLVEWAERFRVRGAGRRAVVVGCGFGDDAEYVAGLGFDTDAFDISASAIRGARQRFPDSRVRYRTADLLDPPAEWRRGFDLVVEIYTLQALPDPPRRQAVTRLRDLVRPGGTLLVIAIARDDAEAPGPPPPWLLTRTEIEAIAIDEITLVRLDEFGEDRRVRAEFRRG